MKLRVKKFLIDMKHINILNLNRVYKIDVI